MAEVEWTTAQKNAIEAENSNILVSAAAGSGKTAVLVERVINKILSPESNVNLDELLVVTFTNAAAAEMKVRISNALDDVIKEHPHNQRARKQLSLLPNAQICTIDSFCINLVRENFFKLDIEQDFRILEQSESDIINQNVIEDIIESLYEKDDSEFKALVELLSSTKNDSDLINAVLRINNFISAQPFPLEWLESTAELYNPDVDFNDNKLKNVLTNEIVYTMNYLREVIDFEFSLLVPGDEMYADYLTMLNEDKRVIEYLLESSRGDWDKMKSAFSSYLFAPTPKAKRGFHGWYKDLLLSKRKLYTSSKSIIKENILPLLSADEEDIKHDNAYLYPVLKSLIKLVKTFNEKTLEYKKEINSYTFSDIEHFAINLLVEKDDGKYRSTELAKELSLHYNEILVDEYQDVNSAQDMLFTTLSNGHNLFTVGDVKQSIYRFRLAEPSIFNNKKSYYKNYSKDSNEIYQKIVLDKNFRSRKDICEFTNFIFSNLMAKGVGDICYDADEYLNPKAEYPDKDGNNISINIVDVPENEDKTEYEARRVAEFIIDKVKRKEQVFDKGALRDIGYVDFAVLLRSTKASMPKYAKVFSQYGIPAVANNRSNLFDNNEVSILISLLRVIDNPIQDIPLLAVLTSVFYGYSEDQIASARLKNGNSNLYLCICNDKDTFHRFLDDLDKYKKYASSMSVENLIKQILSDTSYLALISVMGNCEQRKRNVLKLTELARNFDNGENVGLTAFMRYIDSIINSNLNVESAEVEGESENSVNIMSVHKSKGLEFPVVILADASHAYNAQDERAAILLNSNYGIGLKVNVEEGLYRYDSVQYSALKVINSNAAANENLRVLYVALTRAKEQFAVFASFKKAADHIAKLGDKITSDKLNRFVIKKTNNDADFLLMCSFYHKDANDLRMLTQNKNIFVNSDFDFGMDINFTGNEEAPSATDESVTPADENTVKEIEKRLSFTYGRMEISNFVSKRTASSLDEKEQSYKYFASAKPAFMSDDKLTAAQRGTAMHAFMQYCNYQNAKDNLECEIKRLFSSGYLSKEQADSLNRKKLSNLFSSDFAKRIFSSDNIYREFEVSSFVPLNKLENTEYTDKVLVQGVADLVFEENGGLVLVDYKTDHVNDENELLQRYKNQLAFYKQAVAAALKKPVKESYLYSFSLDKPCKYK